MQLFMHLTIYDPLISITSLNLNKEVFCNRLLVQRILKFISD